MRVIVSKQIFKLDELLQNDLIVQEDILRGCGFYVDQLREIPCGQPVVYGLVGPAPDRNIYLYCVPCLMRVMKNPKAAILFERGSVS